ncbi:hypothetical protein NLG97_g1691 [Lecanicillium saksenae]|uniref:Uncharacterized protein n=1 Tax=Lecanicillium saksenae TaxID=468837 RepID=A0ACC1R326_9HYPO|nr:hypothetical protein NLG97_g1691 [Lecanicillium saksenae]
MATKQPAYTWENGFRQATTNAAPWEQSTKTVVNEGDTDSANAVRNQQDDINAYVAPPAVELVTSPAHNHLGINVIRHWPTLYDGSNNPHGIPSWWTPKEEVDVLICGAGPSGLAIAVSLVRQGLSFRIIEFPPKDKADSPLPAGRADGVQPRFLETISQWGLADEITEEGPLIERTAIYKDGKKLLFTRSHQSDSRYRGLHIITQGQIERIYIRDLARHGAIVERSSILTNFQTGGVTGAPAAVTTATEEATVPLYPVQATVHNNRTGKDTIIKAKFLIGSDGASSSVRKVLNIPFDGVSTNIYWGIMDCIFETDYPHAWVFGSVISSKHGGCVIIPREDGYIRLYTQLDVSLTGPIAASRMAKDPNFMESGGNVDVHSITPEEVLEQANRIFSPYKLSFGAPLSWFAIWKISERVARSYSSEDMRVHLVGDAAHVHSVMGAFGLNASILDAANLAWKLGLAAKGQAQLKKLLRTYGEERRSHAVRIIEVSGSYLRFVCGSSISLPNLGDLEALAKQDRLTQMDAENKNTHTNGERYRADGHDDVTTDSTNDVVNGSNDTATEVDPEKEALQFLAGFFKSHGQFLLGVDCAYPESVLSPAAGTLQTIPAVNIKPGVRAPNPRVCFSATKTGYLYDMFAGPPRFHLVLFASSLAGRQVRTQVSAFLASLADTNGFYRRYGGPQRFNLVVVVKMLPFEWENGTVLGQSLAPIQAALPEEAVVVFDDRAPDEDAHTTWGVDHNIGGLAVVRPDLWVSVTSPPSGIESISKFFDSFLL